MPAGNFKRVFLGLIATGVAFGQLGTISTNPNSGATPPSDDGKVRVYVYRPAGISAKEFRPSIFVDEQDTARLQSGRNVILALNPGTHILRSTDKKDQISIELKPGEKYFVRVEVSGIALKNRGKLVIVVPEQGMGEFGQTKPDDSTMVKNRMLVAPEWIAK
jgi:hypothetical protein